VPLPRIALLLLCAAYVLPGLFARDPWRNADLTAYGLMAAMAEGRTAWLAPTLGGLAVDSALLPHWLGAASVSLLGPLLGGPLAARLPFALLLVATLALLWYATYHLARTEAAQPVPSPSAARPNRWTTHGRSPTRPCWPSSPRWACCSWATRRHPNWPSSVPRWPASCGRWRPHPSVRDWQAAGRHWSPCRHWPPAAHPPWPW
jgi:hypothetical protein